MKTLLIISICLFLSGNVFSQGWFKVDTALSDKVHQRAKWDTTKYNKYHSRLIIGYFQSYRNFSNEFQQYGQKDSLGVSKNNYFAESRLVSGFEFSYDKFSISLGLRTTPPKQSEGKGNTKTFTTNFNFGGNIWYLENSIRYFKGFYDTNTGAYDSTFKKTGVYLQQPNLENTLFRSKFLFFTNHHKYAFRSGYDGSYRQLKSAASWVLGANVSYNNIRSDSSFFPIKSRSYYGDYGNMNGLKVVGISANVGAAATIVILKGFFASAMFIVGPEQQWRTYNYQGRSVPLSYISVSGDFRASIGFNFKRLYVLGSSITDFSVYNSKFVGLTNKAITGNFMIGWRFNAKMPAFYKKFQQTKFYLAI
ncbi:MAG: DUF4421 family protein [Bacteroidetes bacterium]|nr:DUF4421 family protein [Bacteroidota bacterium]